MAGFSGHYLSTSLPTERLTRESITPLPPVWPSQLKTAAFCAVCGARMPSTAKGWKLLAGAFAVFVIGLLWAAAGYQATTSPTLQPQALTTPVAANSNLQPLPQTLELTSAQHLGEAQRALADENRPNKDPKKTGWGRSPPRAGT